MHQEKKFEAGGVTYAIRFTQNARFLLAEQLGGSLEPLARLGVREMQLMMWAGLEGARLKHKSRPGPYTVYEAGDIIDEMIAADLRPMDVLVEAWKASMPARKEEPAADGDAPFDKTSGTRG